MDLYQCQREAKAFGYDLSKFNAFFPVGKTECRWLDASMGLVGVDIEGMRESFCTVEQLSEVYPDLECTAPWVYIPEGGDWA